MKFLLNELNKYVKIDDKSNKELIDIFTSLAYEVEEIYPAAQIKGVKLKKVEDCIKHPNANSLSFLHTDINGEKVEVVCGGKNIENGQIVAHAIPGSIVGKIEMSPKEIRGIVSNGMILSISEIMGISKLLIEDSEEHNIFVFPENTDLESDVVKLLELDWDVFDLSILPDRQYASSYFAMAREIAAYIERDFNWTISEVERKYETKAKIELGSFAEAVFVTNAVLNKDIKTPMWIKKVLYHSGIKPSNNIEDVMKYSMLITGANTYVVDRNTTFKLDDRKLNEIDIFESTSLLTSNIEVSFVTIASSKKANFVNEKKINTTFGTKAIKGTTIESAELTSRMILDIGTKAGFIKSVSTTASKTSPINKEIEIEDSYIYDYLGQEINLDLIIPKLKKINIIKNKNKYSIPDYRRDVEYKADVVEEISRFFGVENITPKPYKVPQDKITLEKHKKALINIVNELTKYGLSEIKTYQLVTEENAKKFNIWNMENFSQLTKDYSLEFNTLQTSFLFGLMESFKINYRNGKNDIRLFEIGNIFYNEKPVYSIGIIHDELINIEEPIFATKELVLKTLELLNVDLSKITFNSIENNVFNKFVSSEIKYEGNLIGLIGEIHPLILRENKFIRLDKVKTKLYYAELQLEKLL